MGRRIRWLGVFMVALFGLVIAQLVNIQLVKGKELAESPKNQRVAVLKNLNHRGEILAADGTVLAKSEPTPAATDRTDYPYDYVRQYPDGSLYSGITGYDSIFYGVTDIEAEYNSYLESHPQSAQTLSQILFRKKLPTVTDNVTLTVEPKLQAGCTVRTVDHLECQQRRSHCRAQPQDWRRARHVLQPVLRPKRPW